MGLPNPCGYLEHVSSVDEFCYLFAHGFSFTIVSGIEDLTGSRF